MKWITRERVKVDRVACPWLIKKFVDPYAKFVFLPRDTDWNAIREGTVYDVPECELGHHGEDVSFDSIGEGSRLSFDYQFKNHPSFEDDAANGRFQITWGILLK